MLRRLGFALAFVAAACGGSSTSSSSPDGSADTGGVGGSSGAGGDAGQDGGAGAAGADGGVTDASGDVDLDSPMGWVDAIDGVWLVGWWGNLNHYSWVRLTPTAQLVGTAQFLDGQGLTANAPYWNCNGTGSWMVTQKPQTVGLTFPAACGIGFQALTFESFSAPPSGLVKGADLYATLSSTASSGPLEGYHFPASQCDSGMTTCADPFQ